MLFRSLLWRSFIAFTATIIFSAYAFAQSSPTMSFPAIVQKVTPSVVGVGTIQPLRNPPRILRGTGFVVEDGLTIVTNAHVLPQADRMADKERIVIMSGRGRNPDVRSAEVLIRDAKHDIAILRITGEPLPALKLDSGSVVPVGTDIAFTGFPIGSVLGLYPVTHKGILSSVTPIVIPQPSARFLDSNMILQTRYDVYQLDATAYPGNSGSPLYEAKTGDVIAILNSVAVKGTKEKALSEPSGISFAIPVVYIHDLLRKVKAK